MKTLKNNVLILLLMLSTCVIAQTKTATYSDTVTDNPTADKDLQLIADYANALVHNNMAKAESLLSTNFINYTPTANQTRNKTETIVDWKEIHKVRTNQKIQFVMTTFKVLQGDLKGTWVSQWGTYTYTEAGIDIELPYHFTARVTNGKIDETRFYYDTLPTIMKMGYTLTPPQKK